MIKTLLMVALLGGFFLAVSCEAAVRFEGGTANVGARFFLETRFSRFFYTNSGANVNALLTNGDPVMDVTASIYGSLPGPFAGKAMNCRACHLVEEQLQTGNRTYADFAPRSPIPGNGDGRTHAPRNSIDLVNSLMPHSTPLFLHYDGQFTTVEDLVITTFTGRNFGWHPAEYATAVAHIAKVVREDDGTGGLAQQYGGWTYAQALAGGPEIPDAYRIAPGFVIYNVGITNPADPNYVSDQRIVQGIAALVKAYLGTLFLSLDPNDLFDGSPYDVFLIKNGLPRGPAPNETPLEYSRRLLRQISNLSNPQWVTDPLDGHMVMHNQRFQFGPTELAGFKIFFTEDDPPRSNPIFGRTGNCISCHEAPNFTDFLFHNTGAAQEEYDALHGPGSFMALTVPGLSERQANYDAFLPPTPVHPNALGTFITPPTVGAPGQADLGLWNVFANPDFPNPQAALQGILSLLMPTPMPQITAVQMSGNDFIFQGTNGTPGWSYHVLTSTNLTSPPASWSVVLTNTFGNTGQFSFTRSTVSNAVAFYRVLALAPSAAQALPHTLALFKTPDLRDLASSEPYMHTGRFNTLPDVFRFYQSVATQARAGTIRNVDPRLKGISLDEDSIAPLLAFLRALNEDYQDIPCPCD